MLPKAIKEQLAKADEPTKKEKEVKDPIGDIKEIYKEQMEYEKAMDPFNRKGRVLDSALDFINMRVQTPFVMDTLKDASTFKQQQLLDAEAIKQGLAKEVQNRAVQSAAAAAVLRQATAAQQDAATRFAQVGLRQPTATFSA